MAYESIIDKAAQVNKKFIILNEIRRQIFSCSIPKIGAVTRKTDISVFMNRCASPA